MFVGNRGVPIKALSRVDLPALNAPTNGRMTEKFCDFASANSSQFFGLDSHWYFFRVAASPGAASKIISCCLNI